MQTQVYGDAVTQVNRPFIRRGPAMWAKLCAVIDFTSALPTKCHFHPVLRRNPPLQPGRGVRQEIPHQHQHLRAVHQGMIVKILEKSIQMPVRVFHTLYFPELSL